MAAPVSHVYQDSSLFCAGHAAAHDLKDGEMGSRRVGSAQNTELWGWWGLRTGGSEQ